MSTTTLARPGYELDMPILDVYSPTGIEETATRVDALATISAGFKQEKNGRAFPSASKDGTIHVHDPEGRAPGLRQALEFYDNRRLLIAFPYDDPNLFIQQRFAEYSAASLISYGDQNGITVIQDGKHVEHAPGTPGFEAALKRCKVSVSVYFVLASWEGNQPRIIYPDGMGFYRLRFTSRNSLRAIVGSIGMIRRFTGGRLAGLPLELSLDYREASDPSGARRKVCVWQTIFKPPTGIELSSQNFRELASRSLEQGEMLMLPAPEPETLELAAADGPIHDDEPLELGERDIAAIQSGGNCDVEYYRSRWHAIVKGTPYATDQRRHEFIADFTDSHAAGLSDFLRWATDKEAAELMASIQEACSIFKDTDVDVATGEISWHNIERFTLDQLRYVSKEILLWENELGVTHSQKRAIWERVRFLQAKAAKQTPLGRAVRAKVENRQPDPEGEAMFDRPDNITPDGEIIEEPESNEEAAITADFHEAEASYVSEEDTVEGDVVDTPVEAALSDEPAALPPYLQDLIEAARGKGMMTDLATMRGAALEAMNASLVESGYKPAKSFDKIREISAILLTTRIIEEKVKW